MHKIQNQNDSESSLPGAFLRCSTQRNQKLYAHQSTRVRSKVGQFSF